MQCHRILCVWLPEPALDTRTGIVTGRETALSEAGGWCSRKQTWGNEIQSPALLGLFLSKVHLSKVS